MEKLTLEIEPFRLWLSRDNPYEVVGTANTSFACPIARYLTDQGVFHVTVTRRRVSGYLKEFHSSYDILPTPPWAVCFIGKVDNENGYSIESRLALKLLKECEHELEKVEGSAPNQS